MSLQSSLPSLAAMGGLNLPGLTSIPPLQMSSSATSSLSQNGASFGISPGDYIVNIGGSGQAVQSAAAGPSLLLIAAALVAVWMLTRKR